MKLKNGKIVLASVIGAFMVTFILAADINLIPIRTECPEGQSAFCEHPVPTIVICPEKTVRLCQKIEDAVIDDPRFSKYIGVENENIAEAMIFSWRWSGTREVSTNISLTIKASGQEVEREKIGYFSGLNGPKKVEDMARSLISRVKIKPAHSQPIPHLR